MIKTLKNTTSEIYNWTKDKVVRFKNWLVILILGAVVVAAPLVLPPNIPDIALEKIQADYHASDIKDKYRLEKTAFILDAVDENAIQAEVGNKNSDEFVPELTLRKWSDEVNFVVKYKHNEKKKDQKVDIENKKIKWSGKKTEVHYYEMKKGEVLLGNVLENDVFEVEVVLLSKPDTNIISFDIETTGLAFYYQPELTQEEIDEGAIRPENVIGSYAVYHESKQGDYSKMGLKNYRAGKAFHIYRPKIIDSAGTEVWGELNITDNLLTVEIPQEFLDNAIYPVRHAAGLTFGYTTLGTTGAANLNDKIRGSNFSSGGTGTGDSITLGLQQWASGEKIKAALYDDAYPTNIITNGATEERNIGGSDGWHIFNFSIGPTIVNQSYNLFAWSDTAVVLDYDAAAGNHYRYWDEVYGSWPSDATYTNVDNYVFSIYCTYTPSATRRMFLTQ